MNRIFLFFLLAFVALSFSSCFEIREEVDLEENGSGKITLTIDFRESRSTVAAIFESGEVQGQTLPGQEDIRALFSDWAQQLREVPGISAVSPLVDFRNFVFSLSVEFEHIDSLNRAIHILSAAVDKEFPLVQPSGNVFAWEKKNFRQLFPFDWKPLSSEQFNQMAQIERYMLETARLIQIFRFDRPVQSHSNTQSALVAPSGKAVRIDYSLADLLTGKVFPENSFQF